MPKAGEEAFQESVGWTLVGENAEQEAEQALKEQPASEYRDAQGAEIHGDDVLNEAIEAQESDPFNFNAERAARVSHLRSEQPEAEARQPEERLRSERTPEEQAEQQDQAHSPTPEEVQRGVEALEKDVEQYKLNEPEDARQFAEEFTAAFNSDPHTAGVNVKALGDVMGKTAVSVLRVYQQTGGDLSKMGEIPEQNAKAFAHDFLKGMGLDPRVHGSHVDSMLLARVTFGGMINFLNTYAQYGGKVTDVTKLNDPQQAEFYMGQFLKALGVEGQVNREAALKFADCCGKQILRVLGKITQARAAEQQGQPRGKNKSQRIPAQFREGVKGERVPKFRSNADIFSGDALEAALSQKL